MDIPEEQPIPKGTNRQDLISLISGLFDGAFIYEEGRVVDADAGAEELLGIESLVGREFSTLVQEDKPVESLTPGKPYEYTAAKPEDSQSDIEVVAKPIDETRYLVGLRDITQRKQAQRYLETKAKHVDFLDVIDHPIYVLDAELNYLGCNQAYADRLGLPREEILGKNYRDFHEGPQTEEFRRLVNGVIQTGEPTQYAHNSVREGGSRFYYRTLSALPQEEGSKAGVVVSATNVSSDDRLVAMCSNCHNVRDDETGDWRDVAVYLRERGANVSHGICPPCARELYPDLVDEGGNIR